MDDRLLDAIALVSFIISIANYDENLTQSDKGDLLKGLEQQTRQIVGKIEKSLEDQNKMLRRILEMLEEKE